jgi:hypothetical protein
MANEYAATVFPCEKFCILITITAISEVEK